MSDMKRLLSGAYMLGYSDARNDKAIDPTSAIERLTMNMNKSDSISREETYKTLCEEYPLLQKEYLRRVIDEVPSAERKDDEENELKFYYVESIDDYWIGKRLDNFYYAEWDDRLGFVWSHSRYLPWGEHIIDENTLWREHTYPSEPVEIPFTKWIVGFMKKPSAERVGHWIEKEDPYGFFNSIPVCSECGCTTKMREKTNYCPNCGARMVNEE